MYGGRPVLGSNGAIQPEDGVIQCIGQVLDHHVGAGVHVLGARNGGQSTIGLVVVVEDEARPFTCLLRLNAVAGGEDEIVVDQGARAVGGGGLIEKALVRAQAVVLLEGIGQHLD